MAKLVSKTYGDAMFEVAKEQGKMDEFREEAESILTVLQQNPELTKLMNHPRIVKEEKLSMIETIFGGRISEEFSGLIRMILIKGHFKEMESVLEYFIAQVREYQKIGNAYVTTAVELSEEQKECVRNRLIETTEYVAFEMHYQVDTAIIGGMVIRIKDRVVDSSIRTKLRDLSRELSKIQLKVGECAP